MSTDASKDLRGVHGDSTPMVLIVSSVIPSLTAPDGFAPRLFHFVQALHSDFSVDLLLVRDASNLRSPLLPSELSVRSTWEVKVGTNPLSESGPRGRIRRVGHYLLDPLPYYCHPRNLPALGSLVRELKPSLVVLHLPMLAHLEVAIPASIPIVFLLEEDRSRLLGQRRPGESQSFKSMFVEVGERIRNRNYFQGLAKRSQWIVVISDEEKSLLSRFVDPENIAVVPHGVDCEYFAPMKSEQDLHVGIFGLFSEGRNYDGAMSVLNSYWKWNSLQEKATEWRWALVGQGGESLASACVGKDVLVTGFVPDLRPYYRRTKVVMVPATQGTGVKSTVLQAWAMARPVIASPFSLRGLPARDNENVLIASDPLEMIERAHELMEDSALACRIASGGRRAVLKYRNIRDISLSFASICSEAARPTGAVTNGR